jgi:hypothetical protein
VEVSRSSKAAKNPNTQNTKNANSPNAPMIRMTKCLAFHFQLCHPPHPAWLGVDIRSIQELLGRSDVHTMEI